ncbi:MAG: M48 family metallopeptidase [Polyangiaceae bacterium]|nr:M48 family metallopeptidase [Polyangiaceae bacterium]
MSDDHDPNQQDRSRHLIAPPPGNASSSESSQGSGGMRRTRRDARRQRSQKRAFHHSPLRLALEVTLALGFLVLVVGGVALSGDRLGRWLTPFVPPSVDEQLGAMTDLQVDGQFEFCDDLVTRAYLEELVELLSESAALKRGVTSIRVVDDESLNAFASPSGRIVVHRGLIEKLGESDEIAAVLAHEIGHVELRHSLKRVLSEVGTWGALSFLWGGGAFFELAAQGLELMRLSYSRDDETEADDYALRTLRAARLDPSAFQRAMKKMAAESDVEIPEFLSTHPRSLLRGQVEEIGSDKELEVRRNSSRLPAVPKVHCRHSADTPSAEWGEVDSGD